MRALLISSALVVVACSAPSETTATATSGLVANAMSEGATVEDDRVVFATSAISAELRQRITAGDKPIIAGDRSSNAIDASGKIIEGAANPYGFVRRALSLRDAGGTTIVMTERVSLEETALVAPHVDRNLHFDVPVIDLSNKKLWSNGGASLTLQSGHVNLATTVDVGTDIDWFQLGSAHVILDTSIDSEVVLAVDLDGPTSESISVPVFHGSWPIGSIGPIPVTLGLDTSVVCDIHADGVAHATAGIGMTASMRGGVQYAKGSGKSPVTADPSFSPRIIAPTFSMEKGSTSTTCHVRPQISIMLFDAAGPTVTPDLAARLDASTPPLAATVTGELGLDVGGKLEIFGKDLGDVNYHLFTVDQQLWSTAP